MLINYFYDCEFLEGPQTKRVFGIPFGKTLNTIDLISIGIVSSDDRELYLVSKEFNLKEAWNRFQIKQVHGDARNVWPNGVKEYWIRENVLKPIFDYFTILEQNEVIRKRDLRVSCNEVNYNFTYTNFKYLLKKHGNSRQEIRWELTKFILDPNDVLWDYWIGTSDEYWEFIINSKNVLVQLYGYYSSYDHVCLAWIYGKMIDLPDEIPMFTRDLKQSFEELQLSWMKESLEYRIRKCKEINVFSTEINLKKLSNYPKQDTAHDALDDAKWNKKLFNFLETLK